MAGNVLKIDIRRSKILEQLKRDGAVSVSKLAADLGTTTVTIRSDLNALESDGYLVRIQGGAVQKTNPASNLLTLQEENVENLPELQSIARKIADRVADGDTLFINSGAITRLVANALSGRRNLNIVTNSLAVAMELGGVSTFRVILLGGEVNAQYGFTSGMDAQDQLCRYQADRAILAVDGISANGGITTYHAEEAAINRMMALQADEVIAAADGSKVGRTGFFRFSEVSNKIHLFTDASAAVSAQEELSLRGVYITATEKTV